METSNAIVRDWSCKGVQTSAERRYKHDQRTCLPQARRFWSCSRGPWRQTANQLPDPNRLDTHGYRPFSPACTPHLAAVEACWPDIGSVGVLDTIILPG